MNKRLLLIAGLVLALPILMADSSSCGGATGGTAPGSTPTAGSSPAPKEVAVGTPMVASDGRSVTVTSFKVPFDTGNEFENAPAGKVLLQVNYNLKNGSSSEWSQPLFELKIIDNNGQKYDEYVFGTDSISSLAAGGHADGAHVVYELPNGLTAIDVAWQPDVFGTTVLQTRIA